MTSDDLISKFKELGIKEGDVILVHSSFNSLGNISNDPDEVINASLTVLGKNGTLIVPTFNFDFCNGKLFNVNETPSQMGIITEFVRKNPSSIRTKDPVYSFAIMGKLKDELGKLVYDSCYGKDSMFSQLRKYKGMYIIIKVPVISRFVFGRKVGYKIERVKLSKKLENISATKIRKKIKFN